jgi:hypothetical protein
MARGSGNPVDPVGEARSNAWTETTKSKGPIYKQRWFWILLVVLVVVLICVAHFTKVIDISPNGASSLGRLLYGSGQF